MKIKNIVLTLLGALLLVQAQAQKMEGRQLIWSIGEVELTRGAEVQVSYPIMVAISDDDSSPQLGSSTMRLFYDAGQLSDLSVEDLSHNYRVSGLNKSNDVFGEIFNFVGGGGIFVQFNIMANQNDLLPVSTEPVRVFNLNFKVVPGTPIPLCAPLVLDNRVVNNGKGGLKADTGYLMNDGGISGTYHLNRKANAVYLADDEVQNYLWERDLAFQEVVDHMADRPGNIVRMKSKTCLELKRPVAIAELDHFDAWKENKKKVRLNWNTLSEFNNGSFEIQRSEDGFFFETIGTIDGQWNSLEPVNYEFLDDQPVAGINYYRLLQVGNDGTTRFSAIKEVAFDVTTTTDVSDWKVSYYPNPSRGKVQLSSNKVFSNLDLDVYDTRGRFVMKINNIASDGPLDLSMLSAGTYSLTLLDREGQIVDTQQIIIVSK